MPTNISIRLGVEGGSDVRRTLEDVGKAGQSAFDRTKEAADRAGAATDRQTERNRRLAQAAREAEAQARAQANVNTLLGVTTPPAGAARASAGVFEAELARQDQILAARQERMAALSQSRINTLLGVRDGQVGGARASASVFEDQFRRDAERRDTVRSLIVTRESSAAADVVRASSFQAGLNDRLGVRSGSSPTGGQAGGGDRAADIAAYGRALDDTRAKFSPLFAAQRDYLGQLAEIRQAVKAGALTQVEGAAAIERTKTTFASQVKDLRTGTGPNRGLRAYEVQSLSYQVNDVATSLASGSSLTQVVAQQAGQIVQPFIGPGSASVRGALDQAGSAAAAFVTKIGPAGIALTALGVGLTAATAAAIAYNSQQKELERTTFVVGRASGATVDQLNQSADAAAGTGTLSNRSAREVVTALNSTGRIDPSLYADVAANMRDLARVMGVDFPEATEATKEALSGGIGGFDKLNDTLGLGGAALRNQVRELYESGKAFEAQRVIVDAYVKRIAEFTGQRPASRLAPGQAASNQIDLLGYLFGDTRSGEQKLADARARVRGLEYQRDSGEGISFSPRELMSAQAEVRKLETSVGGAAEKGRQARTELTSLTVQPLIDSLNPAQRQFEDLERKAKSIQEFLKGGAIDANGSARRAMEGLRDQARQIKEDMAAGGAGFADALRAAEFGRRTSGYAPTAQTAAQIEEDARSKNIAALREAGTNTATQEFFSRLQSIELERTTRLRTLDTDALRTGMTTGGAFSRAPVTIQSMILDASKATGISESLIAAMGEKENGFKLTGATKVLNDKGQPSTTAYGFGQITVGAERDIRRVIPDFDRTNPDTAVLGTATYLKILKDRFNGDEDRAIQAYYGSRDPNANRIYAADVRRLQGQGGEASEAAVTRDVDANARALALQGQQLRNVTENYGVNGAALEANARASQLLSEAHAQGRERVEGLRETILRFAQTSASAERQMRLVQFVRDDDFTREQLGRDRIDQQAYAVARSRFGDTTSPEAQAVIERTRDTLQLAETKSLLTDGVTSFVTDLRRSGDAASALSNAFGSAADRLMSKALDSVISSAFGGGGSSGGGVMSFLSSLVGGGGGNATGMTLYASPAGPGFSGGGWTGPGGRYDVAGLVHRGEVVFSQTDVARHGGVGAVEALRRSGGLRGHADGGIVGREAFTTPRSAPAGTFGGGGVAGGVTVNVINQVPDTKVTTREVPDGRGGRRQEIVIAEAVATGIRSPQGRAALGQPQVARR